jgi:alanyl-tRNA synthetase
MTPEQVEKVEHIVNEKIRENIPMACEEMTVEEAKNFNFLCFSVIHDTAFAQQPVLPRGGV